MRSIPSSDNKMYTLRSSMLDIMERKGNRINLTTVMLNYGKVDSYGRVLFPVFSIDVAEVTEEENRRIITFLSELSPDIQSELYDFLRIGFFEEVRYGLEIGNVNHAALKSKYKPLPDISSVADSHLLLILNACRIENKNLEKMVFEEKPFTGINKNILVLRDVLVGIISKERCVFDNHATLIYDKICACPFIWHLTDYCSSIRVTPFPYEIHEITYDKPPSILDKAYLTFDTAVHYVDSDSDFAIDFGDVVFTSNFSYSGNERKKLANPVFINLLANQKTFLGPSFILKETDKSAKEFSWKSADIRNYKSGIKAGINYALAEKDGKMYYFSGGVVYEIIPTGVQPNKIEFKFAEDCYYVIECG